MNLELKDKVAIVTGGAQGIGKAICFALASEGAKIVIVDMHGDDAERTASEIRKLGVDSISLKVDVTDFEQTQSMGKDVKNRFGKIDILVNNAGTCTWYNFEESQMADWVTDINTSVYGMLNCSRAIIGYMMEQRSGRIVSMASTASLAGTPRQTAYQAAKAAVGGATRALAVEFGRYGIAVNCVAPGLILTELGKQWKARWDENLASRTPEVKKERENFLKTRFPLGQWGLPEDIANMVTILCSERASGHVTGQMVVVDGGMTIVA